MTTKTFMLRSLFLAVLVSLILAFVAPGLWEYRAVYSGTYAEFLRAHRVTGRVEAWDRGAEEWVPHK